MVRRALAWAADAAADLAVADLIAPPRPRLSARERALAADILRAFLADIETRLLAGVRDALGSTWPESPLTPSGSEQTGGGAAQPLLLQYPASVPTALVTGVSARAVEFGIADRLRRAHRSEGTKGELERLLERPDHALAVAVVDYILDEAGRAGPFGRPVVKPALLDPDAVRETIWLVAAAIRRDMLERFTVDVESLDGALEQTASAMIARDAGTPSPAAADNLAQHLARLNLLDQENLARLLAEGELTLFLAGVARAAGLAIDDVRHLVLVADVAALATLGRALGFTADVLGCVISLLGTAGRAFEPSVEAAHRAAVRVLEETSEAAAQQALLTWRRMPEYRRAILRVGP